jgi:hypothetical protein
MIQIVVSNNLFVLNQQDVKQREKSQANLKN